MCGPAARRQHRQRSARRRRPLAAPPQRTPQGSCPPSARHREEDGQVQLEGWVGTARGMGRYSYSDRHSYTNGDDHTGMGTHGSQALEYGLRPTL